MNTIESEVLERAFRAYFRRGEGFPQPSGVDSTIETYARRTYAVLRNVAGVLAVYRVRDNGALQSLKRWPKILENK